MRATIVRRKIQLNGQIAELNIGVIIGWHWPCLSLVMPGITINHGVISSVFELMERYTRKNVEIYDHLDGK